MKKGIIALIIVLITAIYVLSPIDIIPDIVPIVGWIDDIIVVIGALYILIRR